MITGTILRQVAPRTPNPDTVAGLINRICPQYGIRNADILHEFLANLLEECGEFNTFAESLNYSVTSLRRVFGVHRISDADAARLCRTATRPADQVALANILYGGQFGRKNLGNTQPNDGWNFRGSGPIHLTGRRNMEAFTAFFNANQGTRHTAEQMAHLLRTDLAIGMHSACWIFAVSKKLIQAAIDDQFETTVRRINGGLTNFPKRKQYYNALVRLLPVR